MMKRKEKAPDASLTNIELLTFAPFGEESMAALYLPYTGREHFFRLINHRGR